MLTITKNDLQSQITEFKIIHEESTFKINVYSYLQDSEDFSELSNLSLLEIRECPMVISLNDVCIGKLNTDWINAGGVVMGNTLSQIEAKQEYPFGDFETWQAFYTYTTEWCRDRDLLDSEGVPKWDFKNDELEKEYEELDKKRYRYACIHEFNQWFGGIAPSIALKIHRCYEREDVVYLSMYDKFADYFHSFEFLWEELKTLLEEWFSLLKKIYDQSLLVNVEMKRRGFERDQDIFTLFV